jgi:catechol 2,3-dioxygenase-like lactoylglutathione lyase family enzyme
MTMKRLIPMLPVASMPASVEFYAKLGFTVENRNDGWRWAMLVCGDCRLMVDESIHLHPGIPRTSVLYLYPEDIVRFHAQLRASGIEVPELETSFYGMREFRMEDLDGNRLWIGQHTGGEVSGG